MKGLVADMVKEIPAERPRMDEVVARFRKISAELRWWTLRRPTDKRKYPAIIRAVRMVPQVLRTLHYVVNGISSVPVFINS